MNSFDDFLAQKVQNDKVEMNLDNSDYHHLHYLVNLNSTKSKVNRNSMFGIFNAFSSPRFLFLKLAAAGLLIFFIIGNKQNKQNRNSRFLCDSTYTEKPHDTIQGNQFSFKDSLFL